MISLESRVYPLPHYVDSLPKKAPSLYESAGKRLFDLIFTLLITALIHSWLIPTITLAIALTSPGPVFFAQLRTGRNGRPFRCLKFRTTTYRIRSGYRHAGPCESEVTSVGRFLRATRLDELPNFFNVLTGDMSIVGPRPNTLQVDAQYWAMSGYRERQTVRPGIVGLAQTRIYQTNSADLIQKPHQFRYDRWYAQRHSLLLDFKICWWAVSGSWKSFSE